jgi:hypothetical protein
VGVGANAVVGTGDDGVSVASCLADRRHEVWFQGNDTPGRGFTHSFTKSRGTTCCCPRVGPELPRMRFDLASGDGKCCVR